LQQQAGRARLSEVTALGRQSTRLLVGLLAQQAARQLAGVADELQALVRHFQVDTPSASGSS
jgi:hypothetical protein